jgi:glycosyltransferase involved in cell wall biosynthesis
LSGAVALLTLIDWPEPFGLVMIEAMACGTPVIAYSRGAVPEVIESGLTGFIVNNVDEAAAATADVGKLSRADVRQRFEERFTSHRMAQDYLKLYAKLANQQASAARNRALANLWPQRTNGGGHVEIATASGKI